MDWGRGQIQGIAARLVLGYGLVFATWLRFASFCSQPVGREWFRPLQGPLGASPARGGLVFLQYCHESFVFCLILRISFEAMRMRAMAFIGARRRGVGSRLK